MRQAGKTGSKNFGRMHAGGSRGRRQAQAQQKGVGNNAIAHAHRAVNQLGQKANANKKPNV